MKKGTNPNIADVAEPSAIAEAVTGITPMLKRKRCDPVNAQQVEETINAYFIDCGNNNRLPTVEGMALWLGIDRTTLWRWSRAEGCSNDVADVVNRGKLALAAIDAELALRSKISPVAYIFRSKNFYGMADSIRLDTETYHEPEPDITAIANKYEGLLMDKE